MDLSIQSFPNCCGIRVICGVWPEAELDWDDVDAGSWWGSTPAEWLDHLKTFFDDKEQRFRDYEQISSFMVVLTDYQKEALDDFLRTRGYKRSKLGMNNTGNNNYLYRLTLNEELRS